ncbi:MAG: M60 family metallopeptidase, partial [Clostridia bacterium]|nr:M60 family metallopeptidase [Clostridia bacterium]
MENKKVVNKNTAKKDVAKKPTSKVSATKNVKTNAVKTTKPKTKPVVTKSEKKVTSKPVKKSVEKSKITSKSVKQPVKQSNAKTEKATPKTTSVVKDNPTSNSKQTTVKKENVKTFKDKKKKDKKVGTSRFLESQPVEVEQKSINEMWVGLEVNKTTKQAISCVALILGVILIFLPMFVILSRKTLDVSAELGRASALEQAFSSDTFNDYNTDYVTQSKVGYSAEYLGTVRRQHPEVSNGGLARYPSYGKTLNASQEEKQAILNENGPMQSSNSTYNSMDDQGNLYLNGEYIGKKLYKHTAATGMYCGNVSDDEPAVVKKITYLSRGAGTHLTGLYAPAGEVIKIEMSEEDYAKTGGLVVTIGQVLSNGKANNIWMAKSFNRMPIIRSNMTTTAPTSYVGFYLGGPIYIRPVKGGGINFSVTISGAVNYPHFILGYTTEEEYAMTSSSTAPYFDLEVWDRGVRHSGPRIYADRFDYEDLYKAAVLWEKIARVSTQLYSGSTASCGIDFLYDPFVAAGGMVAFVGQSSVNCPMSTLTSALNYDGFVTSGSWGVIHEYNHHFQRYGFAPGDEVTNNAVSLVEYSLFTKISAARNTSNSSEGLSGWNRYTSASWALKNTLGKQTKNTDLDTYANILHSFGQQNFIKSAHDCLANGGADTWFRSLCQTLHYDMSYYFEDILHVTNIRSDLKENAKKYPMYVPVATIYQTGVSYYYDNELRYSETMQPYEIEYGRSLDVDLGSKIVLPSGFSYTIKSVSKPTSGTFTQKSGNVYTYTPTASTQKSGKIYVQLGITKNDGAFTVKDVTLVLEFKQKQEKPNILERTTYTYTEDKMYKSATEAYENKYAGYSSVASGDNNNMIDNKLVQNASAEIWGLQGATSNTVMELKGKAYVSSSGKYRIALRGRTYGALYVSLDGVKYEYAAKIENTNDKMVAFDMNNPDTYKDMELKKGQWLYFKAVLLVSKSNSFIGVGCGKFSGNNVSVSYLNAYRNSYVLEEFTSDYWYSKNYTISYSNIEDVKQTIITASNFTATNGHGLENLFDADENNYILSSNNATANTPCSITVELSKTIKANTFTIYGYNSGSKVHYPTVFELWVGETSTTLQKVGDFNNTNITRSGNLASVKFGTKSFKFYSIIIKSTVANNNGTTPIVFKTMKFSMVLTGGNLVSPDKAMFKYDNKWKGKSEYSNFGHIRVGTDATMNFEFTGTQFAIFSKKASEYGSFEVWIDGTKADTASLSENKNKTDLAYASVVMAN